MMMILLVRGHGCWRCGHDLDGLELTGAGREPTGEAVLAVEAADAGGDAEAG